MLRRPGKLAFAVALILTRRGAFVAPGETTVIETEAAFGSWKSLIVLSTLACAIAGYAGSFLVPVRYESEVVLIRNERDDIALKEMTSRSLLLGVVRSLNWKEDMVDDLRKNVTVTVEPLGEGASKGSSFVVKYLGRDSISAQKAANALARRFVELEMQRGPEQLTEEQVMKTKLEQLALRVQKKGDEMAQHQAKQGATADGIIALEHELLVSSYKAWFAKVLDKEMTSGSGGIRVLDTAQSGTEVAPNRAGLAGLGACLGLAMGGIAVFGLDHRQRRALASK